MKAMICDVWMYGMHSFAYTLRSFRKFQKWLSSSRLFQFLLTVYWLIIVCLMCFMGRKKMYMNCDSSFKFLPQTILFQNLSLEEQARKHVDGLHSWKISAKGMLILPRCSSVSICLLISCHNEETIYCRKKRRLDL